jgi:alpha-tubulin suppressor-like RCC1 family protein
MAVVAGYEHSCALLSGGTVQCWGNNASGQLGNGTASNPDAGTLITVSGLSGATALIAGGSFGGSYSCALLSDGSVKCWGEITVGESSTSPTGVPGLNGGVIQIAGGGAHACALLSDGTVKCWGNNQDGELGSGTSVYSASAVAVSGLGGVTAIAAGGNWFSTAPTGHSCAVLSDGTAMCWGDTLGDGTRNHSPTPVAVSGLSGATAIAAGGGGYTNAGSGGFCCVLLSDHSVKCWGNNQDGELGNGTTMNSPTPVAVTW